jgi:Flp pilus assembly protein TadG
MRKFSRHFLKNISGTAAIEFVLVGPIFLFLAFSIMETSLLFTRSLSLQLGVNEATRQIRTGQFQFSGGSEEDFKQLVCDSAGPLLSCSGELLLDVQTFDNFGESEEIVVDEDNTVFDPGGASEVVVVTAVYKAKILSPMVAAFLANEPDSMRKLSWTVAFENEPF